MNIKKPAHVSDDIWQQHLVWMEVMALQARANREQRKQKPLRQSHTKKK